MGLFWAELGIVWLKEFETGEAKAETEIQGGGGGGGISQQVVTLWSFCHVHLITVSSAVCTNNSMAR